MKNYVAIIFDAEFRIHQVGVFLDYWIRIRAKIPQIRNTALMMCQGVLTPYHIPLFSMDIFIWRWHY
jgi:hypothetical protein